MKTQKRCKTKTAKGGCKPKHVPAGSEQGKEVISFRKTCDAKGTGLSHYILMDRKTK